MSSAFLKKAPILITIRAYCFSLNNFPVYQRVFIPENGQYDNGLQNHFIQSSKNTFSDLLQVPMMVSGYEDNFILCIKILQYLPPILPSL